MKKIIIFFACFFIVSFSFAQLRLADGNNTRRSGNSVSDTQIKTIKKESILVYKLTNIHRVRFGSQTEAAGDLAFVLGGPTVGSNGKPIGDIIHKNRVIKYIHKKKRLNKYSAYVYYNSIFGVGLDGSVDMVRVEEQEVLSDNAIDWAFQNGPALVINYLVPDLKMTHIPNLSEKTYFSGIGHKQNGEIIILITLRKMTIKQFAFGFKDEGCENALLINKGSGVFYSMGNSVFGNMRGSRARKSMGNSTNRYNFLFYN